MNSASLAEATVARVVTMWDRWQRGLVADEFDGVSVAVVAGRAFVRAPDHLRARLEDPPREVEALVARLGNDMLRVVGRGRLAYADASSLRLPEPEPVEPIAPGDRRLAALERQAETAEWLESSSDETCVARVGVVDGKALIAIASLFVWDETVAHFGVFTRSEYRGRGMAARAVTPLIHDARERGLVPQWRSRIDNDASCRVADRLGFVPLGHQMFVRVRPAAAS